MKAAVLKAPYQMSIEDVSVPEPKADEVLVSVKASAVCGSDLKAYEGKHPLIRPPIILGHEFSGVAAAVGSNVRHIREGDRVVVEPSSVCGRCFFCRRRQFSLCEHLEQLGHQLPGSFAEYTLSKARFTYALPEGVSFERASLTQPLAISLHAVDRAGIGPGASVVILGMGAIGLLLLQIARMRGAEVLATDVVGSRLKKALALGAGRAENGTAADLPERIRAWSGGAGPDIVIEAAGTSATIRQAFSVVRRAGTVLLLGISGHDREEVDLGRVTLEELSLLGTMRYGEGDFPRAIDLIRRGEIDLDTLILKRFPLAETPGVLAESLRSPESVLRSVMTAD
jgi:L-iditol 2-dehydrogenase